jgi:hypothetical protein
MQQFEPHPDDATMLTHHLVLSEIRNMVAVSEMKKAAVGVRYADSASSTGVATRVVQVKNSSSDSVAQNKIKNKINRVPPTPKGVLDYSLPLDLMADAKLVEAWARWNTHLAEKKVRRTQSAITAQINKLRQLGALAVPTIDNSITNNWQGLFEPKQQFSGNSQPKNEPRNTVPRTVPNYAA